MFQVGDYIMHGINGVCRVENVGTINVAGIPKDKMYYTLIPVYLNGSKVFVPTDNEIVILRPIISKEKALAIIDDIKNIETLWVPDDRSREEIYKETLQKCDFKEWIRIIKTLYLRNQLRLAEGKKITSSDEKYLRIAEECLSEELAIALNMEKDKINEFITERVKLLDME